MKEGTLLKKAMELLSLILRGERPSRPNEVTPSPPVQTAEPTTTSSPSHSTTSTPAPPKPPRQRSQDLLPKLISGIEYYEQNLRYEETSTLRDLETFSDSLGLRRRFVKEHFSRVTGKSFLQWRDDVMLKALKVYLMEDGEKSLYEIANASGWMSRTKICSLFSEREGIPPKEWRKRELEAVYSPYLRLI